jgi:hypothetical protein
VVVFLGLTCFGFDPFLSITLIFVSFGVGERATNKEVEVWDQSPTKDRRVRFAVDEEVQEPTAEPTKQDRRAPIKMVSGRAWAP